MGNSICGYVVFFAALTGCTKTQSSTGNVVAFPKNADIAFIEKHITGHECIHDLQQWSRYYYFESPTSGQALDKREIKFDFFKADDPSFPTGIKRLAPGGYDEPDDLESDLVSGTFNIHKKSINIVSCGRNHG